MGRMTYLVVRRWHYPRRKLPRLLCQRLVAQMLGHGDGETLSGRPAQMDRIGEGRDWRFPLGIGIPILPTAFPERAQYLFVETVQEQPLGILLGLPVGM